MENNNIEIINISDEMRQSYLDYAMSVIIGRALPDVRDGLKPVQRRVLYAMHQGGMFSNKKTIKCASVVGDVLKKFHPHGDSSVYDALVHLVQAWSKRFPLVEGQGNFGSIDGDPPAAYRYTECRLSSAGESLLTDIEQETVDYIANYDDTTVEPVVLPAAWPNLLVNGADGIAVGMATHIPPHNLGEVINATIELIANPDITIDELMKIIPGPDFPTGGIITGIGQIRSAYKTGRGILKISSNTSFETIKRKGRDVSAIIVNEIPYQVNKSRLIEKIADLVNGKSIEGISNVRDESDREGMRVVIELKKDATEEVVLNQLLKLTPMRVSFGIINLAIVEGKPEVCNLYQMIRHFVDHRRDVIARRTRFQLRKAEERMHLLEGFRIALANLDDVIKLIKESDSPKIARENLIAKYELSKIQAQAILDLKLQKLTGMERLAIENEHAELAKEIQRLISILADTNKMDAIIVEELELARDKFSSPRRSVIQEGEEADIDLEDLIEDEEMAITVSHKGYIKRTSLDEYKAQKRGGKGVSGAAKKEDDFIENFFVASSHDHLLAFSSQGRVYWLKVYQAPEASRTARGRALINLLKLKEDETITTILPVKEFDENKLVVMATEKGSIKKISLSSFSKPRKGGIVACGIKDGDKLIEVALANKNDDILITASNGKSIRFSEEGVREMGRTAGGVRGIKLAEDVKSVGMSVIDNATEDNSFNTVLTICENGYGKRTKIEEYRSQTRGGQGVIDIQTTDRNGPVVGNMISSDACQIMLITSSGKVIRMNASDISIVGRNTKGVRLINLDEAESVVGVAHLKETEEEE